MTLSINMRLGAAAQGGPGIGVMTNAGNPWAVADGVANDLVNRGLATLVNASANDDGSLSSAEVFRIRGVVSGARILDAVSRNITAADNGASLAPAGTITYTIPAGLDPMPSFTVDCPAVGVVSIASSGGATINGAVSTLTRARTANPVGFVVLSHVEPNAYGVSGA